MPNHIHFILKINNIDKFDEKGTVHRAPTTDNKIEKFGKPTSDTVCTIVRYLKSSVTRNFKKYYNYNLQIWQRGFYEHIIRNKQEYEKICEYIKNNPINYLRTKK